MSMKGFGDFRGDFGRASEHHLAGQDSIAVRSALENSLKFGFQTLTQRFIIFNVIHFAHFVWGGGLKLELRIRIMNENTIDIT